MATKNSLTQKNTNTFSAYITGNAIKDRINQMVGGKDGQRFITAIISAVSNNEALQECEHSTIVSAALLGESLKLSPSPQLGQYYMVPYKKKDKQGNVISVTAQFQLGYKGYVQLAIRSGQYKKINVMAIKEGELINFNPLEEEIEVNLISDELERESARTIGYYAMFEYQNGFRKAIYWSYEKMLSHADKYSQAFSADKYRDLLDGKIPQKDMWKYSSFWYKNFDDMALKTMLRQLISKWGVMSIEMQTAYEKDMGIIDEKGNVEFVDNVSSRIVTEDSIDITEETEEVEETETAEETKTAEQESDDFFE